MSSILTFSGSVDRDPRIDAMFDAAPNELGIIARQWFGFMRARGYDVREVMHDGVANVCVAEAPFGYVGVFTKHVSVGFFHGASLPDPARLLQGSGKFMRHVKVKPGISAPNDAIEALIVAAYRDIMARVRGRD